jgi:two-component system chemotaxis response regulator CheB
MIRVVVIDDSAYNRQTIAGMLESDPDIEVVARAADGDEGLKQVLQIQPDLVTLDLEMPRMDGFTFLRILMSRRPTPVIVVSGLGGKENVFKALELGALDFVVKPARQISPELRGIRDELVEKVRLVRQLRMLPLAERSRRPRDSRDIPAIEIPPRPPAPPSDPAVDPPQASCPVGPAPPGLVAIGASTGGPPALQQLVAALDPDWQLGVVITQHMPPRFTRAFAERLQRTSRMVVREAEDGDYIVAGVVLVAPGSGSMAIYREGDALRVLVEPPERNARYTPSVDRMLETAASAMGADVLGIVLTGMGGDGGRGVRAVKARGGRVVAEAAETAVIFGMPNEAIATGAVDEVLPLGLMASAIERFARRKG